MTAISDIVKHVSPHVQACPAPLIEQAIVNASIRFCEASLYWRHSVSPITTVEGRSDYVLDIPDDSTVVSVMNPAYHNGNKVEHVNTDWLNENVDNWETQEGETPKYFYTIKPGVVTIVPKPSVTTPRALKVSVVLKPLPTATTIPDHVYNDCYKIIAHGAISELLSIPDKPWSNLNTSSYFETLFMEGVSSARIKASSGFIGEKKYRKVVGHYM